MLIDDDEETQAERDEAGGIDITGHEREFSWLADMCLGRIGVDLKVKPNQRAVRRCSGFWYVFNGRVFERLDAERMAAMVRPILDRCFYREWKGKGDGMVEREQPLNPTSGTVNEVLTAMVALPGVLSLLEPDQNEDEVIVLNGRLDLGTGELHPHSADVFATRMVQLELPREDSPDLTVAREAWRAYLEGLDLGSATLDYLRRSFGYALTGRGCEKAFWFLHGEKNTSKTTLLRLVMDVVGRTSAGGYAADTDCADWLDKGALSSGHTDSLMGVEGARLVFGDETGENARFNESRLKRAVGGAGSSLRLSAKGERGRDVPIRFALFFSSNHLPSTADNATQDRLKLITHTKVITDPDPNFQRRFLTAPMRQVILQWLCDAAQEYLVGGLGTEPPSVILAREQYAVENDWFATFLKERIGRRANGWAHPAPMPASAISRELARWSKEVGMGYRVAPNRLPAMVERRTGIKPRILGGAKVFDGLVAKFDADGFPVDSALELVLVD
jgi:P4 family phage/plasmid primase-like protien